MATDPTHALPRDIKVLILSLTDQKTVSAASMVSRGWRIAANHYYDTLAKCGDTPIPRELARDINLEKFKARLGRLFARKAPEFKSENELYKSHLQNHTVKLTQFGLFYPYVKKDLNRDLRQQAGIRENDAPIPPPPRIRSGSIRPEQTIMLTHQESIRARPTQNHDPFRAKKAEMLSQACIYGNTELFNLVLSHGAELTVNNLNQAAPSGNRDICLDLLRRGINPNQETIYFMVLTGNLDILVAALEKAPQFRSHLLNKRFELAAKASEQPQMIDYLESLKSEAHVPHHL